MLNRDLTTRVHAGAAQIAWPALDTHWRSNWRSRPYARDDREYEHYRPAYRYGYESARRHTGREWDDVEPELRRGWDTFEHREGSTSTWDEIRDAARDAWDHVRGRGGDDRPERGETERIVIR